MLNDSYIMGRLILPIIMIIILGIMIYFHRRQSLKYLYIGNIVVYLVAILSYFILDVWGVSVYHTVVAIIWVIAIFVAYSFTIVSVSAFLIEQAQRHLWAKIVVIIAVIASIVATILVILWIVVVGVAITTTFS